MTTPTKRLIPAAFAAFTLCLGARAKTVDLSTLASNYTAEDGDVLTGETNFAVTIPDGATVTLSDATINCSSGTHAIGCSGNATIILADGTVNTVSQSVNNCGTIATCGYGTTLTIKGNTGKLVASTPIIWYGAIGSSSADTGNNIVIEGGIVVASAPRVGIGSGYYGSFNSVTIKGGTVTATGSGEYAIYCTTFNVESTITKVELHGGKAAIGASNVNISSKLQRDETDGGKNITLEPSLSVDGEGTENDPYILTDKDDLLMALVKGDPDPMYVQFTEGLAIEGPITVPAAMNALTLDLNGGAITGATGLAAIILAGDTAFTATGTGTISADEGIEAVKRQGSVTASSGVTITGIGGGGGGSVPAPVFAAGGASEIVKFAQAEGGKWTITAFAEMSNESRGTDVTDGQIKVYSADTLEALKSVTTPAAGATVKETKSAVKATVEVPAPSGKNSQFFKVKFGE